MSEMRPQLQPEKPQQELRFTARDPILDESLAMLEREGERQAASLEQKEAFHDFLPKDLFLFAMKRIIIDQSDKRFDGFSQNQSTFDQYRQAVLRTAKNGRKRFTLDPWLKELRAGGPEGRLAGVAFRLRIEPLDVETILSRPFFDLESYRKMVATMNEEEGNKPSNEVLRRDHEAAFIPIRYEIGQTVDDPTEALERLRGVLAMGTWVSQLTIVSSYPRSARNADIYREQKLNRTFDRVSAQFNEELLPTMTQPIDITPDTGFPDQDDHWRHVS